jgi:hypothetical protein
MFTGTLIEELMATVERAEERARETALKMEMKEAEVWMAPLPEATGYDSSFFGRA